MKYLHCPNCIQDIDVLIEVMNEEWAYEQYMDEKGNLSNIGDCDYKRDAYVKYYECPQCGYHHISPDRFIQESKD